MDRATGEIHKLAKQTKGTKPNKLVQYYYGSFTNSFWHHSTKAKTFFLCHFRGRLAKMLGQTTMTRFPLNAKMFVYYLFKITNQWSGHDYILNFTSGTWQKEANWQDPVWRHLQNGHLIHDQTAGWTRDNMVEVQVVHVILWSKYSGLNMLYRDHTSISRGKISFSCDPNTVWSRDTMVKVKFGQEIPWSEYYQDRKTHVIPQWAASFKRPFNVL